MELEVREQADRIALLEKRASAHGDLIDVLRAAIEHLEALEARISSSQSTDPLGEPAPPGEAPVPLTAVAATATTSAENVACLEPVGGSPPPSAAPSAVSPPLVAGAPAARSIPGADLRTSRHECPPELHDLAIGSLEKRGYDGLQLLAESLCSVQLGAAQEASAVAAFVRAFERAGRRWALDDVAVRRDDELWSLGRALGRIPLRLQLALVRAVSEHGDGLFLFELCVASRPGWRQAHPPVAEALASHWRSLHSGWLAGEVGRRAQFNESSSNGGCHLGLYEDDEYWQPNIQKAVRSWHTLAPVDGGAAAGVSPQLGARADGPHADGARLVAGDVATQSEPGIFDECVAQLRATADALAALGDGPASARLNGTALAGLSASRALGCTACPSLALNALLGWGGPEALRSVQHLSLRGCRWLSPPLLCRLLRACGGGLLHLDLSGCCAVDDEVARLIGESAPLLALLDLSGCAALSDDGVCALLDALPAVPRALPAFAPAPRAPSTVVWPAPPQGGLAPDATQQVTSPALERLNLHGVHQLTDRTFARLGRTTHALVELCASALPRLTNDAILSLSTQSACPKLRWLCVCGAYKIAPSSMHCLLQTKPTLLVYNRHDDFPHAAHQPEPSIP